MFIDNYILSNKEVIFSFIGIRSADSLLPARSGIESIDFSRGSVRPFSGTVSTSASPVELSICGQCGNRVRPDVGRFRFPPGIHELIVEIVR